MTTPQQRWRKNSKEAIRIYQSEYRKRRERVNCDCGNPATVKSCGETICKECTELDSQRAKLERRRESFGVPYSGIPIYACHAPGF